MNASASPRRSPLSLALLAVATLLCAAHAGAPEAAAQGASLPDLVVSIKVLTPVGDMRPGGTVDVQDKTELQNKNSLPAGESTTRFYLITGEIFDPATAIHIGSRVVPALGGSSPFSSTVNTELTIPAHAAGMFRFVARADADDGVAEADETNNLSHVSAPFPIGPDLVVLSVQLPAGLNAVPTGAEISVTDTTRNNGRIPVGASLTRFFLSRNDVLDADDFLVGSRPVPELAERGDQDQDKTTTVLSLPAGLRGKFRVIAQADGGFAYPESDETNNTVASAGFLTIGPDLAISSLTAPAQAVAGTALIVSDRTINLGAEFAPLETRTDYYFSQDTVLDATDVLLASRPVPPLNGGAESASDDIEVNIAQTTPGGFYFIIAIANAGHAFDEEPNNNTFVHPIEILPDLSVAVPRDHLLPDFNGDGKGDLVWRNPSGGSQIWLMNGPTVLQTQSYGSAWDWGIQGFGDFNGDGKTDILWRHQAGLVDTWIMDGLNIVHCCSTQYPSDVGWIFQAVGDFNGDGKDDILWRNQSGLVDIWLMDGPFIASANVNQIMTDWGWTIQAVADFNGDGKADILWRNVSGLVDMWIMDGPFIASSGVQYMVGLEWTVQTVGDLNGDGKADIVWRNDAGVVEMWIMNGQFISQAGLQFPVDLDLTLQ